MGEEAIFECTDDNFMVRGRDKNEVMEIARKHVKDYHGMEATDEELEVKVKML